MRRQALARRSRLTVGLIACSAPLVVTTTAPSTAAPATSTTSAASTTELPPPQVALKITPTPGGGAWRLVIENKGDGPVRIPADARLLILELTPQAVTPAANDAKSKAAARQASAPRRCILPDDVRPSTDDGLDLVIPPARSWSTSFDPVFYCFGAKERDALVAGTSVKAIFGWPAPAPKAGAKPAKVTAPNPPFAVAPVGASVGKVAPMKSIAADPITLTEAVSVARPVPPSEDVASSTVTLSVPESMDAARGKELQTTVTLTNGGDRPITLLFRPDMLLFTVSGPAGTVACGTTRLTSPIRELLSTVGVKGKLATTVLFTTTCPAGTFDEPGVYRVLPQLDTTGASGRELGVKTWDGIAVAKAPLLVRVRTRRSTALPPRPTLD